jgi:hypothetical protein
MTGLYGKLTMFDFESYKSGTKAPASGVYECTQCCTERTVKKGVKLPPCHGKWMIAKRTTTKAKTKSKTKSKGIFGGIFG